MARPVGVKELAPRRRMAVRASKDGDAYLWADSGCVDATRLLGRQSLCLECPYDECLLDRNKC